MTAAGPQGRAEGANYVAWPLPAAGGACAGALVGAYGPQHSGGQMLLLLTLAVLSVLLHRLSTRSVGRRPLALALALMAMLVSATRFEAWESRPNPATEFFGQEVRWSGEFDGTYFFASDPVRATFALVAREGPPVGRLVLTATAEPAQGKRNPGGFDYAGYLKRRGVAGQLFVAEVLEAYPHAGVRQRLERGVRAGLSPEDGALVSAMTLGLRDDLGDELQDSFSRAGMAHLLALSGLHFGVLLGAASRSLRRLGRLRVYALLLLTVAFVLVVGATPSVMRAASMAFAYLLGTALGVGRLEPVPVLALAALIALLLQPQMLFDLSFQLSYLALVGILTLTGPLSGRLLGRHEAAEAPTVPAGRLLHHSRLKWFVVTGCTASIAAQLPSLSLIASSFGSVPLLSPLVNLVAVPVSALLVPLGYLAGLLGLIAEPLAWLVNRLTVPVVGLLTSLARLSAKLPALTWAEVGWLGHFCWLVAMTAFVLFLRRKLRLRQLLGIALTAGVCSAAAGGAQRPPDVWFLDVGQGDATLIRLPGRFEILIDGGGSPFSDDDVGERVVIPALRALGVDELELVVATHPDADHVEGLFSVLEHMPVSTLVTSPAKAGNELDRRLREIAAAEGVAVHVATRAETLVVGRRGEATLEVLHPLAGGGGGSANEESVVLLLRYGAAPAVLLLADVGAVTERELALGRVAVLKVGHHGSRFSTSDELLKATSPGLAVISVGKNNYNHPHPSVLERLAAANVPVVSTRRVGAVRFDLSRPLPEPHASP